MKAATGVVHVGPDKRHLGEEVDIFLGDWEITDQSSDQNSLIYPI